MVSGKERLVSRGQEKSQEAPVPTNRTIRTLYTRPAMTDGKGEWYVVDASGEHVHKGADFAAAETWIADYRKKELAP
jgi:hypothetical protein